MLVKIVKNDIVIKIVEVYKERWFYEEKSISLWRTMKLMESNNWLMKDC